MSEKLWVRAGDEAEGDVLHNKAELTARVTDQATGRKHAAASCLRGNLSAESANQCRHTAHLHKRLRLPPLASVALWQVQDFLRNVAQAHLPAYRCQAGDDDFSEESLDMISGMKNTLAAHLPM